MHRSNVTGLVDRLEQRGLVKRREVDGDRRAYRVVLTREGIELMRKVLPRYHEGAARIWENLSNERAAALITDLKLAAENAQRAAAGLPKET